MFFLVLLWMLVFSGYEKCPSHLNINFAAKDTYVGIAYRIHG